MKKSLVVTALFLIALHFSVKPIDQKKITSNNQIWLGDYGKININKKIAVLYDLGVRNKDWISELNQILFRVGSSYYLNPKVAVAIGVAYFKTFDKSNRSAAPAFGAP